MFELTFLGLGVRFGYFVHNSPHFVILDKPRIAVLLPGGVGFFPGFSFQVFFQGEFYKGLLPSPFDLSDFEMLFP